MNPVMMIPFVLIDAILVTGTYFLMFFNIIGRPVVQIPWIKMCIRDRPGNGVCHQLQLENFSKPGETLVGSDSHTPTCGAMGMIAIGAGGLDVAVAMATGKYYLQCPSVIPVSYTHLSLIVLVLLVRLLS